MRQVTIGEFIRVSKAHTRKLYQAGKTVYFCPVNLSPCGFWFSAVPFSCHLSQDNDSPSYKNVAATFDSRVNAFEFYNCTDSETGKYTAFYIKY